LQKEALPVYPQQGAGQGQSLSEENGTYGVTKHLVHTEEGPGRVRRVSAAVVVNDRSVIEGAGKMEHTVWKPRSPDEMHRLEELAQAAVGYDARRGDQVVMENVSFSTNAPEATPPTMDRLMDESRALLHTQPELMRTVVMGLCGVLLVLFVLRPVARQVTATLREPVLLSAGAAASGLEMQDERRFASPDPGGEEMAIGRMVSRATQQQQGIFDHVSEHIRREPAQSTRVLEAWIGTSEEAM
jgi:flagellar M-ring protein FliF